MSIITNIIIPSCFGFIISRSLISGDMATAVVAICGLVSDVAMGVALAKMER